MAKQDENADVTRYMADKFVEVWEKLHTSLGWTKEELARTVGVSSKTLNKYLKWKSNQPEVFGTTRKLVATFIKDVEAGKYGNEFCAAPADIASKMHLSKRPKPEEPMVNTANVLSTVEKATVQLNWEKREVLVCLLNGTWLTSDFASRDRVSFKELFDAIKTIFRSAEEKHELDNSIPFPFVMRSMAEIRIHADWKLIVS